MGDKDFGGEGVLLICSHFGLKRYQKLFLSELGCGEEEILASLCCLPDLPWPFNSSRI